MWSEPRPVTLASGSLPWTGKVVSVVWKAEYAEKQNLAYQIPVTGEAGNAEPTWNCRLGTRFCKSLQRTPFIARNNPASGDPIQNTDTRLNPVAVGMFRLWCSGVKYRIVADAECMAFHTV